MSGSWPLLWGQYPKVGELITAIEALLPSSMCFRMLVWTYLYKDPIEAISQTHELSEWGGIRGLITPPVGDAYIAAIRIDSPGDHGSVYAERRSVGFSSFTIMDPDKANPARHWQEAQRNSRNV